MDLIKSMDINPCTANPVDLFCLEVATAAAEDIAEALRLAWLDRLAADTTQDKGWTHQEEGQ
jgi:hypothetical protein